MVVLSFCTFAQYAELGRAADALGHEAILEALRILDLLVVDADHDVAGDKSRLCRRALGRDLGDERARRRRQPERIGNVRRYRLERRAEPGPLHRARP